METKKETFIYKGLGFPIELIDCPMKKMIGEWVIDINMNTLQLFVFRNLLHKPFRLTGPEMRFMRKFLGLTCVELGENLDVSHATVVKWEKNQSEISGVQEVYIRMFFMEKLKDAEINELFKVIKPKMLAESKTGKTPLPIHASHLLKEAI